jgi:cytochrome P450
MLRGKRLWSLFASPDENFHAQFRRSVNAAFSMNSLMGLEPLVSEVIEIFLDRTDQLFADTNQSCDFARWLQYFAFDVVGQITYSRRHGFIEKNEDIDGIITFLARLFSYAAPVGQMPWLDLLLLKNPLVRMLDYFGVKIAQFPVTKFARARVLERRAEIASNKRTAEETGYTDLLSKFLIAQEKRPEFMTDLRVLTMSIGISFAGSDTTAISLAAVFYYLLRNPQCMNKVRQEMKEARADGRIESRPSGIVNWSEAQTLPYLDACIKEAFRLHPAVGLMLERVVPDGGADIAGHFIPGGTIVGCNAWVIHHKEDIFGTRIDDYVPERWLDCTRDCRKEMEAAMFQFGAGSRTCIGKNISLLEIYKLVPSFLSRFEVRISSYI